MLIHIIRQYTKSKVKGKSKLKLTNRLLKIASLVSENKRLADIGTDHGYIPVYLLNEGKINFAILADINKGPLENARSEVKRNKLEDKVDLRLGSGIEVLKKGEVDEVIIAGMGGILIGELLEANKEVAYSVDKLILQPMQAQEELRQYLLNNGYEIFIKDENTDNGYCLCLVENSGERTFITVQGTECEFKKEWLDKLDTNKYNKVYISGYELEGKSGGVIAEFLEKNTHMEIYFAPGPRITYLDKDIMNRIYNLSPIIHLNDKEASEYTNKSDLHQAIEEIHEKSNNSVFITLGPKGVLYKEKNNDPIIVEGYNAQVIDTIGAGDSHIAGIIGAKSMEYDNISVCKIANKIAAKVVSTKGPKLENKINIEEI